MTASQTLLQVDQLDVAYRVGGINLPVLRDISFSATAGEIVGIVGESGCGKSTLGAALMGQLPSNATVVSGRIEFEGQDIAGRSQKDLRRMRGAEMAMIFQDPLTSLNPTFTIWDQMRSAAEAHLPRGARGRSGRAELRRRALDALAEVGVSDGEQRLGQYPHQLSGGLRQRVMIAIALMLRSRLLVADEPTSALDVTLQAQIVALLARLRRDHGTSIVFISHDLGLVSRLSDRVLVMYCGNVVESGPTDRVLHEPHHPYTRALLQAAPSRARRGQRLASIPGRVPSLSDLPRGCLFAARCPLARAICREVEPRALTVRGVTAQCHAHDPSSGYADSTPLQPQEAR